jgi:hypothetical protein
MNHFYGERAHRPVLVAETRCMVSIPNPESAELREDRYRAKSRNLALNFKISRLHGLHSVSGN